MSVSAHNPVGFSEVLLNTLPNLPVNYVTISVIAEFSSWITNILYITQYTCIQRIGQHQKDTRPCAACVEIGAATCRTKVGHCTRRSASARCRLNEKGAGPLE